MGARSNLICGTAIGLILGLGLIVGPTVLMVSAPDAFNDGLNRTMLLGKNDMKNFPITI